MINDGFLQFIRNDFARSEMALTQTPECWAADTPLPAKPETTV